MKRKPIFLTGVLLALCLFLGGCGEPEPGRDEAWLIRVGTRSMSVPEFGRALELAKTAYPHDIGKHPAARRKLLLHVLKEASERMLLAERAEDIGVSVSDPELDAAIAKLKQGYPQGEFEKTQLESAVSFDFWKKELKTRMLMEKVAARELSERIVADGQNGKGPPEKNAHRKKAEAAYGSWMEELREKYPVEINKAQWENIMEKSG